MFKCVNYKILLNKEIFYSKNLISDITLKELQNIYKTYDMKCEFYIIDEQNLNFVLEPDDTILLIGFNKDFVNTIKKLCKSNEVLYSDILEKYIHEYTYGSDSALGALCINKIIYKIKALLSRNVLEEKNKYKNMENKIKLQEKINETIEIINYTIGNIEQILHSINRFDILLLLKACTYKNKYFSNIDFTIEIIKGNINLNTNNIEIVKSDVNNYIFDFFKFLNRTAIKDEDNFLYKNIKLFLNEYKKNIDIYNKLQKKIKNIYKDYNNGDEHECKIK